MNDVPVEELRARLIRAADLLDYAQIYVEAVSGVYGGNYADEAAEIRQLLGIPQPKRYGDDD